jgi:hypothetical protein
MRPGGENGVRPLDIRRLNVGLTLARSSLAECIWVTTVPTLVSISAALLASVRPEGFP